jgi:AAA domain/UvrD-like helicase C-terminal domain
MSLAAVRHALRSDHRNVLVEAPAGCGKTFEAAELAAELGVQLPDGAEVLLLAHTNAAVQEFTRRIRGTGARVRATTIDAFCVDLLTPYSVPLGLPTPFRRSVGLGAGRMPFEDLAPHAVNLLARCPPIATMLAYRYPFVILDEHQDANLNQHEVVRSFRQIGQCRVRVFGDPMQAIYETQIAGAVRWDRLAEEAQAVVSLTIPQRWSAEPALGEWILNARSKLRDGRPLPLARTPASIRVRRLPGATCAGFGYGNPGTIGPTVREFANNLTGSMAILSRHNNHVWGLHVATTGRLRLNEGAEFDDAYLLLERAVAGLGNPPALATCLIDHIVSVSTGLDQAKRRAISAALQPNHIDYGRHRVIRNFLSEFEQLYLTPDLKTFCEMAKAIVAGPPDWLTIRMPMTMRLLGQIWPRPDDDPAECLDEVIARFKAGAPRLVRSVGTIHKAKGLEFDHVLIANFSAGHFPDDEMSRRVAYVALSRARRSITLLVPGESPSPLLG